MTRFLVLLTALVGAFVAAPSTAQLPPGIVPPATGSEIITCVQGGLPKSCTSAQIAAIGGAGGVQNANTVLAGPTSGGSAASAFRGLVAADIPGTLPALTVTNTNTVGKLNIVPATAPGSPNNGDCWITTQSGTTPAGLFCQINGSAIGPFSHTREPGQFLSAGQTIAQLTTGAIDASVAFNAAISSGNVFLQIPCGVYRLDNPVHITQSAVRISGRDTSCVSIQQNFTSGSAFQIDGGPTAGISNIIIDHVLVSMKSGVTKTSGASYHVNNAHGVYFSYANSVGDFIGYDLQGGVAQFTYMVDHAEVLNASSAAIRETDDGTATNQVKDVYLSNIAIGGSSSGILLNNASGTYATNIDICCNGGTGVLFAPGASQNVNATFMVNVLADQNTSSNGAWNFAATGGFISETYLTNCWGAGSTAGNGLSVNNTNTNVLVLNGFNSHSNYGAGIAIAGGSNITINGAGVYYNSLIGSGNQPGILINGSATKVQVVNSIVGKGGYVQQVTPAVANNQSWGVLIQGSATKVIVSLNVLDDNVSGTVSDTSSGSAANIKVNNL